MIEICLIRATDEFDDEGMPLWWSNDAGWTRLEDATVFLADTGLPMGGEIVWFESVEVR
jgi:hypothetical protein